MQPRGAMTRWIFLPACLLVLVACGHQHVEPNMPALRHRALLDLHCKDVTTHDAGPRTMLVRGCGQEAVYVHQCEVVSHRYGSYETDCVWMLNRGPTPLVGPVPCAPQRVSSSE